MPNRSIQDSLDRFVNANSQDSQARDDLAAGVMQLGLRKYHQRMHEANEICNQFYAAFARNNNSSNPSYDAEVALREVGRRAADKYTFFGGRALDAIHEAINNGPR